jgi:hypothetical protein
MFSTNVGTFSTRDMRRRKNHVVYPIRRSNLGYLRQHAVARMHLFTKLTSDGPLQDDKLVL